MKKKYTKVLLLVFCVVMCSGCQIIGNEGASLYFEQKVVEKEMKEIEDVDKIDRMDAFKIALAEESSKEEQAEVRVEDMVFEQWEDAYGEILCNIENLLANPSELRKETDITNFLYIGIHDFDDNGTPELIAGDILSLAIFSYEEHRIIKIADLYQAEFWMGIDGVRLQDNKLFLEKNGSDGSWYVGFTYEEGEYITATYEDYHPEEAYINGEQVSGEEFRELFDLTEFIQGKNIPRLKGPEEPAKDRLKIDPEDKGTIIIEGEKVKLEELDFSMVQW